MSCVWCAEEDLAIELIKALSSPDVKESIYLKSLPDLYHCMDCVNEYHRLQTKCITTTEGLQTLLDLDVTRLNDQLVKTKDCQQELKNKNCVADDSSAISYMWRPLVEMLRYPHLFLCQENMGLFCDVLLWEIENIGGNFIEPHVKYPGLFLLLVNPSRTIKDWAIDCVSGMPMITNEDYYIFKPVLSSLINIVLCERSNSNDQFITETTVLPGYMYGNMKSDDLWVAYAVIFNVLRNRIVKMFMNEKNRTFLSKITKHLENTNCFWSVLKVLQILLEKLGSGFWLLTNLETPMQFYILVTTNVAYQQISKVAANTDQDSEISMDGKESCSSVFLLFPWFLPFLKSIVDFGSSPAIDSLTEHHLEILEQSKMKKKNQMFGLATNSLFAMISYLSDVNQIVLLVNHVERLADMFLTIVKKGNIDLSQSAFSLAVSLVTKNQACLPDRMLDAFTLNFKNMKDRRKCDKMVVKNAIIEALKSNVTVKSESIDDKKDALQQIKLRETLGSALAPIVIADDDDLIGCTDGVCFISSDIETEEEKHELTDTKANIKFLPMEYIGSFSPVRISDDEENENLSTKSNQVDFLVSSCVSRDVTPHSSKQYINNGNEDEKATSEATKTKTSVTKNLKKIKLDEDIFRYHKTKQLIQQAAEEQEKKQKEIGLKLEHQVVNKDATQNENCVNISYVKDGGVSPVKRKSTIPKRPTSLKRESFEKSLTETMKPIPLPCMKSKTQFTSALYHDSILGWEPEWLEKKTDEFDIKVKLGAVPLRFETYDNYVKVFWPLLLLETWSQVKRDYDEFERKTVPYVIDSIDERKSVGKICHILCSYYELNPGKARYEGCPTEDDLVIVAFKRDSDNKHEVFAIVENIEKMLTGITTDKVYGLYTLSLKMLAFPSAQTYKYVSVTRITSLKTVFRRWNAVIGFQNSLLARDILKPFRKRTFCLNEENIEKTVRLQKLNEHQYRAVSIVSKAVLGEFVIPRIVMLQGPPGTGKSYTVKTIITHLLQEFYKRRDKAGFNNSRSRILVCAPSNAAIDEIAKRLYSSPPWRDDTVQTKHQNGNCGDFNLLRIGRRSQVDPMLHEATLECLIEARMKRIKKSHDKAVIRKEMQSVFLKLDELDNVCVKLKMSTNATTKMEYVNKMAERTKLQQKYDQLNRSLEKASARNDLREEERKVQQNLLLQADVICCTLSGAGSKCMLQTFKSSSNRQIPFKCVIIDEAGQCTEPDALIPLQYGASKLVLVGDPAQLPATVLSQRASRYNFGQSLFERLFNALIIENKDTENADRPALMLNVQYRMAPDICSFPSKRFYHGELLPAKELLKNKKLMPLKQFVMLNLVNGREKQVKSGALHNPCERDHIIAICKSILESNAAKPQAVSVITPYRQQLVMLKDEFRRHNLQQITVKTVDGYQGQEREIVIFSCVRGPNERKTIGFLKHPQRMNVALTRAKHSLIILAHCDSLEVDEDWKALVDDARNRSLLFDVKTKEDAIDRIFSAKYKQIVSELNKIAEETKFKAIAKDPVHCMNVNVEKENENVTANVQVLDTGKSEKTDKVGITFVDEDGLYKTQSSLDNTQNKGELSAGKKKSSKTKHKSKKSSNTVLRSQVASALEEENKHAKFKDRGTPLTDVETIENAVNTVAKHSRTKINSIVLSNNVLQRKDCKNSVQEKTKHTKGKDREALLNHPANDEILFQRKSKNLLESQVSKSSEERNNKRSNCEDREAPLGDDKKLKNNEDQSPVECPISNVIDNNVKMVLPECTRVQQAELDISATSEVAIPTKRKAANDDFTKKKKRKKMAKTDKEVHSSNDTATSTKQRKNVQLQDVQIPLSIKLLQREKDNTTDPVIREKLQSSITDLLNIEMMKQSRNVPLSPAVQDMLKFGTQKEVAVESTSANCVPPLSSPTSPLPVGSTDEHDAGNTNRLSFQRKLNDVECVGKLPKLIDEPLAASPASISSDGSDTFRFIDSFPHSHRDGTLCTQICSKNRRGAPSSAYFSFPHRHTDGTFCKVECKRVIEREKKTKLLDAQTRATTVNNNFIRWKLQMLEGIPDSYVGSNIPPEDPRARYLRDISSKESNVIVGNQKPVSGIVIPAATPTVEPPLPSDIFVSELMPPEPINPVETTFPDERQRLLAVKIVDPRLQRDVNLMACGVEEPMELSPVLNSTITINIPSNVFDVSPNLLTNDTIPDTPISPEPYLEPNGTSKNMCGNPIPGPSSEPPDLLSTDNAFMNYTEGFLQSFLDGQILTGASTDISVNAVLNLINSRRLNKVPSIPQAATMTSNLVEIPELTKALLPQDPVGTFNPIQSKDVDCNQSFLKNVSNEETSLGETDCVVPNSQQSLSKEVFDTDMKQSVNNPRDVVSSQQSINLLFNTQAKIETGSNDLLKSPVQAIRALHFDYENFKSVASVPKPLINNDGVAKGVESVLSQIAKNVSDRHAPFGTTSKFTGPLGVGFMISNISKTVIVDHHKKYRDKMNDTKTNENFWRNVTSESFFSDRYHYARNPPARDGNRYNYDRSKKGEKENHASLLSPHRSSRYQYHKSEDDNHSSSLSPRKRNRKRQHREDRPLPSKRYDERGRSDREGRRSRHSRMDRSHSRCSASSESITSEKKSDSPSEKYQKKTMYGNSRTTELKTSSSNMALSGYTSVPPNLSRMPVLKDDYPIQTHKEQLEGTRTPVKDEKSCKLMILKAKLPKQRKVSSMSFSADDSTTVKTKKEERNVILITSSSESDQNLDGIPKLPKQRKTKISLVRTKAEPPPSLPTVKRSISVKSPDVNSKLLSPFSTNKPVATVSNSALINDRGRNRRDRKTEDTTLRKLNNQNAERFMEKCRSEDESRLYFGQDDA